MVGASEARRKALKKASYERRRRNLKKQLSKTNRLIAYASSNGSTSGTAHYLHDYKRNLLQQLRRQDVSNNQNASGTLPASPPRRNRVSFYRQKMI